MTRAAAGRTDEYPAVNTPTASLEFSADEGAPTRPANTNASAFVETWPDGDPRSFARLLAQILVRRALIDAGMIPDEQRCEISTGLDHLSHADAKVTKGRSHR